MTWIYRTAKKNDRIDARKMAVLLSIGEIPEVHMPLKEVRQWRETILHRKKIVDKVVMVKNRIRATFKGHGLSRPAVKVYVVSKNGIHKLYTITILFFCTDLLGKSRLNDIRSIDPEYPGIDSVNSRFEAAKAQDNK
jgi:transposase